MKEVLQKTAENNDELHGRLDPVAFDQYIQFATHSPPADLALFIDHFWVLRWDEEGAGYTSEQVMHRPYVDIFVSSTESGIQGTFRGKRIYKTTESGSGRIVGARFRPGAFHAFWDGEMADLQDKNIDITHAFPRADTQYIDRIVGLNDQAAIQELIALIRARRPQLDANIELINKIITAAENDEELLTVAAVAKASGRSERWLQQLFSDYVGVGLKWLLQRHKLLIAAQRIRENDQPDWVAIAYDSGYSSQQHFITDFKRVLDKTPLQYKKELTTP